MEPAGLEPHESGGHCRRCGGLRDSPPIGQQPEGCLVQHGLCTERGWAGGLPLWQGPSWSTILARKPCLTARRSQATCLILAMAAGPSGRLREGGRGVIHERDQPALRGRQSSGAVVAVSGGDATWLRQPQGCSSHAQQGTGQGRR
jgi:hypothetical protein